jgi:hypothetical protein
MCRRCIVAGIPGNLELELQNLGHMVARDGAAWFVNGRRFADATAVRVWLFEEARKEATR